MNDIMILNMTINSNLSFCFFGGIDEKNPVKLKSLKSGIHPQSLNILTIYDNLFNKYNIILYDILNNVIQYK